MSVNIQTIAEKAGVSLSTVSYALNNKGRIHEKTRKKILKIAKDLGYRRNLLVSGIRLGKSQTVAVISNFNGDFANRIVKGVCDYFVQRDYAVIVFFPCDGKSKLDLLLAAVDRRVDGIILWADTAKDWSLHLNGLELKNTPLVCLDHPLEGVFAKYDLVATDDFGGGKQAGSHLLGLGHRHFGVIDLNTYNQVHLNRSKGFESVVKSRPGTTFERVTVDWKDVSNPRNWDLDWGLMRQATCDATLELLKLNPRPTALFTSNDMAVPGIYDAAKLHGLHIPRDLSVVGFADLEFTQTITPPLTTVRQYPEKIGESASEFLMQRIQGDQNKEESQQLLIGTDLVTRLSTVSPPPLETPLIG